MQLEDLIAQLNEIVKVHPYATVRIGIPDTGVSGDQLAMIREVHYEHDGNRAVIEL